MHCTNKNRKYYKKGKNNKKTRKHLVKNKKTKKLKKSSIKYRKQKGGMSLTNNALLWTLQDGASYLINTLNGTPVPANSNPTSDQFQQLQ